MRPGISRCTVRSRSWTEGVFKLGSNAPTLGAVPFGWNGCSSDAEGAATGTATLVGKPEEMRLLNPLGVTQPAVGVMDPAVSMLVLQPSIKPGVLPAIAVAWNVEITSNIQA